jgi:hypothetical protein
VTPINIVIPESLIAQKEELESLLGMLAREEERLAAQRRDIQAAINAITNGIALLEWQTSSERKCGEERD